MKSTHNSDFQSDDSDKCKHEKTDCNLGIQGWKRERGLFARVTDLRGRAGRATFELKVFRSAQSAFSRENMKSLRDLKFAELITS
jgi:hypothetical protein